MFLVFSVEKNESKYLIRTVKNHLNFFFAVLEMFSIKFQDSSKI